MLELIGVIAGVVTAIIAVMEFYRKKESFFDDKVIFKKNESKNDSVNEGTHQIRKDKLDELTYYMTQPLCTKVHRLPPGLKVLNHSRIMFPVSILDG